MAMSKGAETRDRIVEHAVRLATRDGLEGLSIGGLAIELGLSKSGLFAHFGSKEDLQVAVLQAAAQRFEESVLRPAFRARRGEPRLRALFEGWLAWVGDPSMPGGCLFVAAAVELDDRDGRPREYLVAAQKQLIAALTKAARLAVEASDFRPELDASQFAFDLYGVMLSYSYWKRLLRDSQAEERTRASFERLIVSSRLTE
jgi:AcrR family transcriptional regulator